MGDYSSTFNIANLLDSDINLVFPTTTSGYWLRKPTSIVKSNATTDDFQLKDSLGFSGSDGQVHVKGMLNGREFVAWIHVKCGVREINCASFESSDKRLHLGVSGFINPHNNPMTGVTFRISAA